jgi:hypothetical protein
LNVIVPPAAAPAVPVRLMTGLAGWVAVPPMLFALSPLNSPRQQYRPAEVT